MDLSTELLEKLQIDPVSVLNRGYRAKERIRTRQERIKAWRDVAESITVNLSSEPGSGEPSNRVERAVVAILDLEHEIAREIEEIARVEMENGQILDTCVTDPTQRAIMEHRYMEFKPWDVIAYEMGYTVRWVLKLHGRAIQAIRSAVSMELSSGSSLKFTKIH